MMTTPGTQTSGTDITNQDLKAAVQLVVDLIKSGTLRSSTLAAAMRDAFGGRLDLTDVL